MKYHFLFFLFAAGLAFSQQKIITESPESVGISTERLKILNGRMHKFVDEGKISSVQTAIMRRGKLIHFNTYGYKDIESQSKLNYNSIFRIYSMTKPIVSIALMILFEEGKFQLFDPIEKYIPELREMKAYKNGKFVRTQNKIKIIDLLRHTSGIGSRRGNKTKLIDSLYINQTNEILSNKDLFNIKDLINKIKNLPLNFEPSTEWKYGLSTNVIGHLVEILSGLSLDKYLEDKIFKPLGMDDTSFKLPKEKISRFVTQYSFTNQNNLKVTDHPSNSQFTKNITFFSGGGGLLSSMEDYLIFCQMLLNKGMYKNRRIVGSKTIELMTSDHLNYILDKTQYNKNGFYLPKSGTSFGLGFAVTTNVAESNLLGSVGSYGWGGAAGTFFRIDPKEDLIYILMIQNLNHSRLMIRQFFQNLVYQSIID